MGRKKIKIQEIENDRQKNVTFSRRRCGLIKKAHELSVLCDCRVVLLMFDNKDACHIYSSGNADEMIDKYCRRDFKTFDQRRKEEFGRAKVAVINDYRIAVTGEGSEDISVCQIKQIQPLEGGKGAATMNEGGNVMVMPKLAMNLQPASSKDKVLRPMKPSVIAPSAPMFFPTTTTQSTTHSCPTTSHPSCSSYQTPPMSHRPSIQFNPSSKEEGLHAMMPPFHMNQGQDMRGAVHFPSSHDGSALVVMPMSQQQQHQQQQQQQLQQFHHHMESDKIILPRIGSFTTLPKMSTIVNDISPGSNGEPWISSSDIPSANLHETFGGGFLPNPSTDNLSLGYSPWGSI